MHLRTGVGAALSGWLFLAIGSGVAAAGSYGSSAGTATEAQGGLDAAIAGVLITLVVGGFAIWLGRSYAESVTGKARSEPGRSFLVGFLSCFACSDWRLSDLPTDCSSSSRFRWCSRTSSS